MKCEPRLMATQVHTGSSQTIHIEIHEDNSGAVYLTRGEETWALGPVTRDMYGQAADTARAWAEDEWEPNEGDGQHRADLDDMDHIATWRPAGLVVIANDVGTPMAGAGGSLFLGLEA
jgi:hypothetical protein